MRKTLRTTTAVLALPALINAVALSDMTPRAEGLPPACNNLYTAQISGCTSQDWQSQQCSPTCSSSMEALVGPIVKACGGQGISGQNLIVAFLAGVGPQQLCHNLKTQTTAAAPTTTAAPTTQKTTQSTESTTTAAPQSTTDTSLSVGRSSSTSETSTRKKTTMKHTTPTAVASSSAYASSSKAVASSTTHSAKTSSSRTTTADGNSQTNLNDHSGGGSPFDTAGNLMNAASGLSVSVVSLILPAVAAAVFAAMR